MDNEDDEGSVTRSPARKNRPAFRRRSSAAGGNAPSSPGSQAQASAAPGKPREEQSYTTFFPDLDVDEALPVLWNSKPKVHSTSRSSTTSTQKHLQSRKQYLTRKMSSHTVQQSASGTENAANAPSSSLLSSISNIVHDVVNKLRGGNDDGGDGENDAEMLDAGTCSSPAKSTTSRHEKSSPKRTEQPVDPGITRSYVISIFDKS
jgi:hypothetical protein